MSHAHVQISGKSLPEIHQATANVFRGEGYRMTVSRPDLQVFERLGSRRDALKWGGLLSGGVVMRVKVAYTELQDDVWLLQADAYAVQDAGDPFFEDESRNVLLNRHPYQKLLYKVEKQLK